MNASKRPGEARTVPPVGRHGNPINTNLSLAPYFMPMESASASSGVVAKAATPQAEGLRGVQVSNSSISLVDGVNGRLLYRGYNISDLAEHSSFEETSYLLLNGELPTKAQLKAFKDQLAHDRALPPLVLKELKQLPHEATPMDALRTGVSLLGSLDAEANDPSPAARRGIANRLVARIATLVAAFHRIRTDQPIVKPRRSGSHAANFLRMLSGEEPDAFTEHAMDVALILHADHEFNASTFSARVTASTLSDPYSAVTSAVGTLKGPLHGGANLAVMRQLREIQSVDRVERWVSDTLGRHEKVFGFGHAVYRTMDPRAAILKKYSEEAGKRVNDPRWYQMSARLQDVVQQSKGIWPNVDFYSASVYHTMGIADELFPPIFAVSRISGWMAHILEQYENNKLIRPLSNYVGPQLRPYVTIGRRK